MIVHCPDLVSVMSEKKRKADASNAPKKVRKAAAPDGAHPDATSTPSEVTGEKSALVLFDELATSISAALTSITATVNTSSEDKELKLKNQQLEVSVKELKAQLYDLSYGAGSVESQLKKAKSKYKIRISELEKEVETLRARLGQKGATEPSVATVPLIADLQIQLRNAIAAKDQMQEQCNELQQAATAVDDIAKYEARILSLTSKNAELKTMADTSRHRMCIFKTENERLRAEVEELQAAARDSDASYKEDLVALQRHTEEQSEVIAALTARLEKAEEQLNLSATTTSAPATATGGEQSKQLAIVQKKLELRDELVEELQTELAELKATVKEKDQTIVTLQHEQQETTTAAQKAQEEVARLQQVVLEISKK